MGDFGILPKDFYQMSLQEVLWTRNGRQENELRSLRMIRFQAFWAAAGYLKKGTTMNDLLPLDEEVKTTDKTQYQKILERYQAAGYLNDKN